MSETRCSVKGCPWPDDAETHRAWCLGIPGVPHSPDVGHQHHPKKGMGGNNPNSEIVAVLCNFCHDKIDNTVEWANAVISVNGRRYYRAWDLHNNTLIERELPDADSDLRRNGLVRVRVEGEGGAPDRHGGGGAVRTDGVLLPARPEPSFVPQMPAGYDGWSGALKDAVQQRAALSLRVALLLEYGLGRYGEDAWQGISDAGLARHTVENALTVLRTFSGEHREILTSGIERGVDWSMFQAIGPTYRREPDKALGLLAEAEATNLTIEEVRGRIKAPVAVTTTNVEPGTPMRFYQVEKMWTVAELRERLAGFRAPRVLRNQGRRHSNAFLDSLEVEG